MTIFLKKIYMVILWLVISYSLYFSRI